MRTFLVLATLALAPLFTIGCAGSQNEPTTASTIIPTVHPSNPESICDGITGDWKISAILRDMAMFQNTKTREEFTIQTDKPITKNLDGKQNQIYLEKSNIKKFTCVIRIDYESEEICRREFKMFE